MEGTADQDKRYPVTRGEKSLPGLCSADCTTYTNWLHDMPDQIFAPYSTNWLHDMPDQIFAPYRSL
jgi:hypothetical protein